MTEIIDAIDASLNTRFAGEGLKSYGLAELVKKGEQVHPVTIDKREQIAINDRWEGIVYHRILSGGVAPSEDDSFGATIAKMQSIRIRTVLATKVKKGENFRFEFANAIPEILTVDNFRRIDVSENMTMIEDQEGIYLQEFGGGDYEKHINSWNINAFEYDVAFVVCTVEECSP